MSIKSKAGAPFHGRFLLIRPFGILEFLLHAGDFLLEQTEKLLSTRKGLPRGLEFSH